MYKCSLCVPLFKHTRVVFLAVLHTIVLYSIHMYIYIVHLYYYISYIYLYIVHTYLCMYYICMFLYSNMCNYFRFNFNKFSLVMSLSFFMFLFCFVFPGHPFGREFGTAHFMYICYYMLMSFYIYVYCVLCVASARLCMCLYL